MKSLHESILSKDYNVTGDYEPIDYKWLKWKAVEPYMTRDVIYYNSINFVASNIPIIKRLIEERAARVHEEEQGNCIKSCYLHDTFEVYRNTLDGWVQSLDKLEKDVNKDMSEGPYSYVRKRLRGWKKYLSILDIFFSYPGVENIFGGLEREHRGSCSINDDKHTMISGWVDKAQHDTLKKAVEAMAKKAKIKYDGGAFDGDQNGSYPKEVWFRLYITPKTV